LTDGLRRALGMESGERRQIIEQARHVARSEFHPQRIASDLFEMYNRAIELNGAPTAREKIDIPLLKRRGRVESPARRPAGDVVLRRSLTYSFAPKHNHWNGMSVFIGTHQRPAKGTLRLQVLSQLGAQLRESAQNIKNIMDNSWVELRFPPIPDAAGKTFRLKFSMSGSDFATKVSFYELETAQPKILRLLRHMGIPFKNRTLYCKSWYQE
jgi:hypothetical protein